MYLGFHNFYPAYNANRMFEDPSSPIGDDLAYPLWYLAHELRKRGHQVATVDMDAPDKFNAVVFLDHPTALNRHFRRFCWRGDLPLYLMLCENPANRPDNYWRWNHRCFAKVFTWHPGWVDGHKYIRFFLANRIPVPFEVFSEERSRFCTTIASQKYSGHPCQLYSERVRAIRWFENRQPNKFDLYGTDWDRPLFTGKLSRLNLLLQRIYRAAPTRFQSHRFPSYRGKVKRKNTTLRQYRFSLCYENAIFPGYITEKLFDCLFAGCIPVYLGAPDVADYVPTAAFVDKRNFKTYEDLFLYLDGMSTAEYEGYLSAIHAFVTGSQIQPFGADAFVDLFITHIIAKGTHE